MKVLVFLTLFYHFQDLLSIRILNLIIKYIHSKVRYTNLQAKRFSELPYKKSSYKHDKYVKNCLELFFHTICFFTAISNSRY